MIHSRITSKAQTTVPLAVRRALGVGPGDTIAYEIKDGQVVVTRVEPDDDDVPDMFVNNFSTFTEWADELDSVYDDL
jgi:antitoxin PrlF